MSPLFPEMDIARMNLTQLHERLRLELLRRIERGTASVSLLARQTGFGQSHMSNFLHHRRQLSLAAMDRILAAQHIQFIDLMPSHSFPSSRLQPDPGIGIPVVADAVALSARTIVPSDVRTTLHVPAESFSAQPIAVPVARRSWQRFVAVRTAPEDARAMDPLLLPDSLCVIDRHSVATRSPHANRASLFAVRRNAHLTLRYAEELGNCLILRPHNTAFPLELIALEKPGALGDILIGRVVFIFHRA